MLLFSCAPKATQIAQETLTDIKGGEITLLSEGDYLLLVTSTECGYCLVSSPYFNSIAAEFGDRYECIALYETGKEDIEFQGQQYENLFEPLKGWSIIPDASKTYMKYIEKETYPQILVVLKGEIVKTSIGTIAEVQ